MSTQRVAPQADSQQVTPQADILNVQGLAKFLGVPVSTIHGLTRKRARLEPNPFPHFRLGKRIYARRCSVLAWLEAKEQERKAVPRGR